MSLNRQERYMERQHFHAGELEISERAYNLIIGGTLLYGFLVNCFMIKFCYGFAVNLIQTSGWLFFGLYFIMCIAGSAMVNRSVNPVVSFIGYNLIVVPLGLVLSILVNVYIASGYSNTVVAAFGITSLVTVGMMLLSTIFPYFFLNMGRTLLVTLLLTIAIELIMMVAGASLGIIDYIVVFIFCGYIGYDWARANNCARTVDNAIDSAAELYVDIINIFVRILSILSRSSNN
ncbi:MAG: Bax inhibitor-1 family protein [Clostridium sp.]|nr:Bax inhibitor-1 family protein [Clostridium sp.]MCM1398609.1 Bax inhibitor-1 family protein [Clostridium sp.]MCM1459895.1 Bax inhibitor-1 family protein [Bacteroides sp.]